jgi:hypothetical protein
MSSILSRIAAVGIIAGGFALTGDLGRLAKRAVEVVNSRDIPAAPSDDATPAAESAAQEIEAAAAAAETTAAGGPATTAAGKPATGKPAAGKPAAEASRGKPALARDADFRPPQGGVDAIELATLAPGNRVVVWLTMPRSSGGRAYRCLVFDLIDPASGEALAYEAVSFATDGKPQATAVPPRRVRLQGDGLGGAVAKSGRIDVQRRGSAADGIGHETIGPIAALDVVR